MQQRSRVVHLQPQGLDENPTAWAALRELGAALIDIAKNPRGRITAAQSCPQLDPSVATAEAHPEQDSRHGAA